MLSFSVILLIFDILLSYLQNRYYAFILSSVVS